VYPFKRSISYLFLLVLTYDLKFTAVVDSPTPVEPFPHVNDTAQFQDVVIKQLAVDNMTDDAK
jgi:hypothetical protein